MNQVVLATFGGLIGSVLTVAISRICDFFQKRMEHKFILKRAFFEKKLSVAEAVISQRYILASILERFSALLEEISKNMALVILPSQNILKPFGDGIAQQIQRLNNPTLEIANEASLFFDIDELEYSSISREVLSLIISLSVRNLSLQVSLEQYFKEENEEAKKRIFETTKTNIENMQKEIKVLSEKTKIGSHQASTVIRKIRSDMKKFES